MARLILFLLLLAAVVYAVSWLLDHRSRHRGNHGDTGGGGGLRRPHGPLGPDDDEAFLRELERRRRHNQGEGA